MSLTVVLVIGIPLGVLWGWVIYRWMKKHSVDVLRDVFDAGTIGMPSSLRPFHFKPEIEDGKGHTELLDDGTEIKHKPHHQPPKHFQ